MAIYDLSLPITNSMLVWPGVASVEVNQVAAQEKGAIANESTILMHVHNGTHIDAPLHFIPRGLTVDQIDLDILIGSVQVIDATQIDQISAGFLKTCQLPIGTQRVLFHTRNSQEWQKPEPRTFCKDYVAISEDGARWLVERGIRLVGIDYLSVAPFDAPIPTHHIFLGAGIILIESLNLIGIAPGEYHLVCLPLKITGCEGAPARVILMDSK